MSVKVLIAVARTLGLLGVFGLALFDSSLLFVVPGINDFVLISFVASKASWGWAVVGVVAATVGSVIGGLATYNMSRRGGTELLRKRLPKSLQERVLQWTGRGGALPVGISAVLPPPFPYAPFVIAAGVMDVRRGQVGASIGIGRGIRYSLEAVLAMMIGRKLLAHFNALYWDAFKDVAILALFVLAVWSIMRLGLPHRRDDGKADVGFTLFNPRACEAAANAAVNARTAARAVDGGGNRPTPVPTSGGEERE
jgi:membrane protein YqaA with SNARE-associated domain